MTVHDALFACLGLISAASAICAVATRQIVHAALWLTVCLATLSGCYLVLGAELVALVQLLVYVGAVVVLVLFAVMLTRAPIGRSGDHDAPIMTRMAALVIAAATGGLLFSAFVSAFGTRRARIDSGTTTDLAQNLFGRFAWPFEVVSLVLLSALVGALAMIGSRRSGGGR
ncbi:NADH-quinone oxidoreductase subunit J [Dermacoccus sp. GAS27A]|uniref:NADH-quinone oxidoreductase subunit J family protein n=1 Tax=Dermacoccus sp. GAS27A TaxID=3156270 RepID=UPI00383481B2